VSASNHIGYGKERVDTLIRQRHQIKRFLAGYAGSFNSLDTGCFKQIVIHDILNNMTEA
jgi:hypothetical protein